MWRQGRSWRGGGPLDWEESEDEKGHVSRIQTQRRQVVISLTSAPEIARIMFNTGELTAQEMKHIDEFHLTPFRANEELLAMIKKKPRKVYESFLSILKQTKQYDVYQLLKRRHFPLSIGEQSHRFLRRYEDFTPILYDDPDILDLLLNHKLISYREYEFVISESNLRQRNDRLSFIISGKSSYERKRLEGVLEGTGQEISIQHLKHVPHEHSRFIWQNYELLSSSLDADPRTMELLAKRQVIDHQEYWHILNQKDHIRRNEALLDIIFWKSEKEFIQFKYIYALEETRSMSSLMRKTDIIHDKQTASEYSSFIQQNYRFITSNVDVTSRLLPALRERQVISLKEHDLIASPKDRIQQNETMLSVIHHKSNDDFKKFIIVWEEMFSVYSEYKDGPSVSGSTDWRLRPTALQMAHAVTVTRSPPSLETKLSHPFKHPEPIDISSELHFSAPISVAHISSTAKSINKKPTMMLTDRFKKLPDGLQTEVSTKVVLISQSSKSTSSTDSLWDMCLQAMIQGFQMVNQPKLDIIIENSKYKAVIGKHQLHVAELRGEIKNLEFQNMEMKKRLHATEMELLNLKEESRFKEQRIDKESEHIQTMGGRQQVILRGGEVLQKRGFGTRPSKKPGVVETKRRVMSDMFKQDELIATTDSDKSTAKVRFFSSVSVDGKPTEEEVQKKMQQMSISQPLTKQQRNAILQKMKSFRFPNVAITTCIFEDDYVEFYFVQEGTPSIDKSLLVNEIVMSLAVDASFAERIRVTQLKSKPRGERTQSGPGNPIINTTAQPSTMTTLGAFVSIEGKGEHVLSCGHDKKVGHVLSTDNNEIIGQTQAVVYCVEDGQSYDAALAKVQNISYTKSVTYEGRRLHLSAYPVDPVKGTVVQRFPPQPITSRATIRHVDYNSFVHDLYGCMSVITDNRETFHRPGESGLVVTSLPNEEFPERVDPIGMLFFREFIEKTDDGRGYYLSLAIPMTKNLEKLQEDDYCGGRNITILRDA